MWCSQIITFITYLFHFQHYIMKQFRYQLFIWLLLITLPVWLTAQISSEIQPPFPVQTQFAEGLTIQSVIIILEKPNEKVIADSLETEAFFKAFQLRPGSVFRQSFADFAITRINEQSFVRNASYELFNSNFGSPVLMVVRVVYLKSNENKTIEGKKGMKKTGAIRDFPLILETDRSQLRFLFNGGVGLFNENNSFFSKGEEFTKGNPVADNPAGKGVRFWGETFLEPGIAGITRLGNSKLYAYGSATVLFSARNTSDIYSEGPTIYADFERLYAGLLVAGLGKNKQTNLDLSAGRQFFQLNDGFLIAKFSGSANAGERGSVYLNSRTAFQKTIIGRSQINNWHLQAFFLEPQELFKDKQSNTNYTGISVMLNNNKLIDAGLSYINTTGGTTQYRTPQGSFGKKGMYVINPKLWLKNIASTGLFFRSEYAYQAHSSADMKSNAWYLGLGIKKDKWRFSPSLYYRYAYMQGDDSTSKTYEKFDPILTGGLGNWVQGINFRKVVGNGNIISHRVELKANFTKSFEASLDYFFLKAHTLSNIGALAPIAKLNANTYGQEWTLTTRYFLNTHFMLLGILSYAKPGDAIQNAFPDEVYPWTSVQAALFMFF
jgi:Alginate export